MRILHKKKIYGQLLCNQTVFRLAEAIIISLFVCFVSKEDTLGTKQGFRCAGKLLPLICMARPLPQFDCGICKGTSCYGYKSTLEGHRDYDGE